MEPLGLTGISGEEDREGRIERVCIGKSGTDEACVTFIHLFIRYLVDDLL